MSTAEASEIYPLLVRYSTYSHLAYSALPRALRAAGESVGGTSGVYCPSLVKPHGDVSLLHCHRMEDVGFSAPAVVYATFENDILATPFAVFVDEEDRSVVISIRGTATLEDAVTDLQFDSSEMERVGEVCKVDMKGMYAHRGMLAKSKWICNELFR